MIKVILNGAAGRMGQAVQKAIAASEEFELAAAVDLYGDDYLKNLSDFNGDADVIIDFSNHAGTKELTDYAVEHQLPLLIATTGHSEEELKMIDAAARKIPVFHSANMSLGVALLVELAKKAAVAMPGADIEIIETHHNRKLDAPSGTALMIARALQKAREKMTILCGRNGQHKREPNEIGISAVRRGNITGIHEVILSTDNESITIKHEAHSRDLFADGALAAARFLLTANQADLMKSGVIDMTALIGGNNNE